MILFGIKQLLRRPGKAVLFFLLLAAVTLLLTFSTVSMIVIGQRIDAAEGQFTTIGTVTQNGELGGKLLKAEDLEFDGAGYIHKPETRPYYLAYDPEMTTLGKYYDYRPARSIHIVEFSLEEDFQSKETLVKARVEKALYNYYDHRRNGPGLASKEKDLDVGDTFLFYENFQSNRRHYLHPPVPFEKGKTYIGNLRYDDEQAQKLGTPVYKLRWGAVFTSQYDPDSGTRIENGRVPTDHMLFYEVTEDFWEPGNMGELWMEWIEQLKLWDLNWFPVIPTNSTSLLPTFHDKKAYVWKGRFITEEEFSSGAKVCMVPQGFAVRNGLSLGDTLRLPLSLAFYGFQPNQRKPFEMPAFYDFSTLNADGKPYETFFEGEYEIVGIYRKSTASVSEIYPDSVIVPMGSVTASDKDNVVYFGPMNDWSTSFQIPNGKIEEFDAALRNAVPEAGQLKIEYDDSGYGEVMDSLRNARLGPMLLFLGSSLAALAVLALLLYFFIVKEKKRTAVERSLGMTRRQCRISLLSGILALTFLAASAGSAAGYFVVQAQQAQSAEAQEAESPAGDGIEDISFSRDYSLWAKGEVSEADIELDQTAILAQGLAYFMVPAAVCLVALLLAVFLANRNLQIEPILLMSRGQE